MTLLSFADYERLVEREMALHPQWRAGQAHYNVADRSYHGILDALLSAQPHLDSVFFDDRLLAEFVRELRKLVEVH